MAHPFANTHSKNRSLNLQPAPRGGVRAGLSMSASVIALARSVGSWSGIRNRYQPGARRSGIGSGVLKSAPAQNKVLFEALEPRILMSADLPIDAFDIGLDEFANFLDVLDDYGRLGETLPIIEQSLGATIDLGTTIHDGLAAGQTYLQDALAAGTTIDVSDISASGDLENLANALGAGAFEYIAGASDVVTFDFSFSDVLASEQVALQLDGYAFDAAAQLDYTAAYDLNFTLGYDFDASLSANDAFFFSFDNFTLSGDATLASSSFGMDTGGLSVSVVGASLDLSADLDVAFTDPDADGRLTLQELKDSAAGNITSIFDITATGTLDAILPFSVALGDADLNSLGTPIVTVHSDDIFSGTAPEIIVDVEISTTLKDQILGVLVEVDGAIDDAIGAASGVLDTNIPLIDVTVGNLLGLSDLDNSVKLHAAAQDYFDNNDPLMVSGLLAHLNDFMAEGNAQGFDFDRWDSSDQNYAGNNGAGQDFRGFDFRGANLSGVDFTGANLSGVDFRGADLSGAVLLGANLRGAQLSGANLRNIDLSKAFAVDVDFSDLDLSSATLTNMLHNDALSGLAAGALEFVNGVDLSGFNPTDLVGLDLSGLDLQGINFSGFSFEGVNLRGVDLTGVDLSGLLSLKGAFLADITGLDLTGVTFTDFFSDFGSGFDLLSGFDLTGLGGFDLSGFDFSGIAVDLPNVNFAGANLNFADLAGLDFNGFDFSGLSLRGVDLSDALNLDLTGVVDLIGIDLSGIDLSVLPTDIFAGLDLRGANLAGLDLTGFDLSGVNLSNALLQGVNFSGVDLSGVLFQGANLTGADLSAAIDLAEAYYDALSAGFDFLGVGATDLGLSAAIGVGTPFSLSGGLDIANKTLEFGVVVDLDGGFEQGFTFDAASLGLDPSIDITGNGTLLAATSLDLDLGFGVELNGGAKAFVVFNELAAAADVTVSGLDLVATVAGTGGTVADGYASLSASVDVDINDPTPDDGRLYIADFADASVSTDMRGTLEAVLPLDVVIAGFDLSAFGTPLITASSDNIFSGDAPDVVVDVIISNALKAEILSVLLKVDTAIDDALGTAAGVLDTDIPLIDVSVAQLLGLENIDNSIKLHAAADAYFSDPANNPLLVSGLLDALNDFLADGNSQVIDLDRWDSSGLNFAGFDATTLDPDLRGFDFTGANLSGVNFTGMNLSGVDFTGADLSGAIFDGANLRGAILNGAKLLGASLKDAFVVDVDFSSFSATDLAGVDLSGMLHNSGIKGLLDGALEFARGIDLSGVDLTGLDLSGLDLSGIDFTGLSLDGVNLRGVSGLDLSGVLSLNGAFLVDIAGLDLTGFSGYLDDLTDLSAFNFNGLDLSGFDFSGLDLTGVNFGAANLDFVNFSGLDLSGINFNGLSLRGVDLSGVIGLDLSGVIDLVGIDLSGIDLSALPTDIFAGLDLRGANLAGLDLTGFDLSGVNLSNALLQGVNFSGVDLSGVLFQGANLTGADLSAAIDLAEAYYDALSAGFDFLGVGATDLGLSAAIGVGTPFSLSGGLDIANKTLEFGVVVDLDGGFEQGFTFDAASLGLGAGYGMTGSGTLQAVTSLDIDLAFGVEVNSTPTAYLVFNELAASADISVSGLDLGASVGGVTASVVDGYVRMSAGVDVDIEDVTTPSDGRLYVSDFAGAVVSSNLSGTLDAVLPLDMSLAGITFSDYVVPTVLVESDDIFSGLPGFTVDVGLGETLKVQILDALLKIDNAVESALNGADDVLGTDIPLVGVTVGELLGLDDIAALNGLGLHDAAKGYIDAHIQPTLSGLLDALNGFMSENTSSDFDFSNWDASGLNFAGNVGANLDFRGFDFSGANLAGVDFTGANLSGIDFTGADLSGAILDGANLRGAILSGANLLGASLKNAFAVDVDFTGLDLDGVDLAGMLHNDAIVALLADAREFIAGVNLSGLDLTGLDLSGLDLTGISFDGLDMSGVNFGGVTGLDLTGVTHLIGSYLIGVNIGVFDLSSYTNVFGDIADLNINLSGFDLSGFDFTGLDLSGLDFSGANLDFVNFNGLDLNGIDFSGLSLRGVDLSGALNLDLSGVSGLFGVDLSGITFDGSIPTVDLHDLLKGLDLRGANLSGLDLTGFDLSGALLQGADLSGVIGDLSGAFYDALTQLGGLDAAGALDLTLSAAIGVGSPFSLSGDFDFSTRTFEFGVVVDLDGGFSKDFTFDTAALGLPASIGLSGSGNLQAATSLDLDLGFGIELDSTPTAYMLFNELTAAANLAVSGLDLNATIGVITGSVIDGYVDMSARVALEVEDPTPDDGRLTIGDFTSGGVNFTPVLSGSLDAVLPLDLDLAGITISDYVVPTVLIESDDLFGGGFSSIIDVGLGTELQSAILDALTTFDSAMATAAGKVDSALATEVPLIGGTLGDLLGISDLSGDIPALKPIAQDYINNHVQTTLSGLIEALNDAMAAANAVDFDFGNWDASGLNFTDKIGAGLDFRGFDFSGANLHGVDFSGANLSGVDFSGADLSGIDFSGANLRGAILDGAKLLGANFTNAFTVGVDFSQFRARDLAGVDLTGMLHDILPGGLLDGLLSGAFNFSIDGPSGFDLRGLDLTGLDFTGIDFTGLDLSGVNLRGVDLSGALNFGDVFSLDGAFLAGVSGFDLSTLSASLKTFFHNVSGFGVDLGTFDFTGYDLSGFDFSGLGFDFTGVNFAGANLDFVNFNGLDLSGLNLNGLSLRGMDLGGVTNIDLSGVLDLVGANLRGLDISLLTSGTFSGLDMRGVDLSGFDFTGFDLSGVDLSNALLQGADFAGVDLSGIQFLGAKLAGADLSGALNVAASFYDSLSSGFDFKAAGATDTTLPDIFGGASGVTFDFSGGLDFVKDASDNTQVTLSLGAGVSLNTYKELNFGFDTSNLDLAGGALSFPPLTDLVDLSLNLSGSGTVEIAAGLDLAAEIEVSLGTSGLSGSATVTAAAAAIGMQVSDVDLDLSFGPPADPYISASVIDGSGSVVVGFNALEPPGSRLSGTLDVSLPVHVSFLEGMFGPDLAPTITVHDDYLFDTTPPVVALDMAAFEKVGLFALVNNADFIVGGIDGILGGVESMLSDGLFGLPLPFIGDALQAGGNFIGDLRTDVNNELTSLFAGGETPLGLMESALESLFGTDVIVSDGGANDSVQFDMTLSGVQNLADIDIDFDKALNGLGLKTDAVIGIDVGYEFDFGFGFSLSDGFYLNTANNNELEVYIKALLDKGSSIDIDLGILGMSVEDKGVDWNAFFPGSDIPGIATGGLGSGIIGSFNVDLRDTKTRSDDGRLSTLEIVDAVSAGKYFGSDGMAAASLNAAAVANFDASVDFGGGFLGISTDFYFEQTFTHTFGDGTPVSFGEAPVVEFNNVSLDLGGFITNLIDPILDKIKVVTEPIQPIVDLLTMEIPVISDLAGPTTLLDLADIFGGDKLNTKYIRAIVNVVDLINSLPTDADGISIGFGDFSIGGTDLRTGSLSDTNADALAPSPADFNLFGELRNPTGKTGSGGTPPPGGASTDTQNFIAKLTGLEGLDVPLLTSPANILKLLTGQTVDLVTYDMPQLVVDFQYARAFPIFPGLNARFGGEVGAEVNLGFGFDTAGINEFQASGNALDIFNGFYLKDYPGDEIILNAGITAGASLGVGGLVEAGVEGGIFANIGFDLHDIPDDTGAYDAKIRASELAERFSLGPHCIFDTHGEIRAALEAFLWVGLDLGFFGKVTIFDERFEIFSATIASFDIVCPPKTPPVFAEMTNVAADGTGTLQLNMGDYAGNRLASAADRAASPDDSFLWTDGAENFKVWQYYDSDIGKDMVQVSFNGRPDKYLDPTDPAKERRLDRVFEADKINTIMARGGDGNDIIIFDKSLNANIALDVHGGAGDDKIIVEGDNASVIYGNAGNDVIVGGGGIDEIHGGGDADKIFGGLGDDKLYGDGGIDRILGQDGDDLIRGGSEGDFLLGGLGDDTMYGGLGNDVMRGEEGGDWLDGGGNDDRIEGGEGNDVLLGGYGDDNLTGGIGVDVVLGQQNDDSITWIDGDGADSFIAGGLGDDTFFVDASANGDTIDLSAATLATSIDMVRPDTDTTITLSRHSTAGTNLSMSGGVAALTLGTSSIENMVISAGEGADTLTINDLTGTGLSNLVTDLGESFTTSTVTVPIFDINGDPVMVPDTIEVQKTTQEQATNVAGDLLYLTEAGATTTDQVTDDKLNAPKMVDVLVFESDENGNPTTIPVMVQQLVLNADGTRHMVQDSTEVIVPAGGNDLAADSIILHGGQGANANRADVFDLSTDGDELRVIQAGGLALTVQNAQRYNGFAPLDALNIYSHGGADAINAGAIGETDQDLMALSFIAGTGADTLVGSAFDDVLDSGLGDDTVTGNAGVDTFFDAGGYNTLVETRDHDISLFDDTLVVGQMLGDDGGTFHKGEITKEIDHSKSGVNFDIDEFDLVKDWGDDYAAGAEVEDLKFLFQEARITGGDSYNILAVGDLDNTITVDGTDQSVSDWTGIATLDNAGNSAMGYNEYYLVTLGGDSNTVVNINDSGGTSGFDELHLYGTLGADEFELLGGDSADISHARIMFGEKPEGSAVDHRDLIDHRGVERVVINTLSGDDLVLSNDNAMPTIINMGLGDDTLVVGTVPQIPDTDNKTFEYPDGIPVADTDNMTHGNSAVMYVFGQDGNDLFEVNHNAAKLYLHGGDHDDTFIINTFLVIPDPTNNTVDGQEDILNLSNLFGGDGSNKYTYLQNAPVFINGGSGNDTLVINGTAIGDTFVVTDQFVAGAGRITYFTGIERLELNAASGDDKIFVLSTKADLELTIRGGSGDDTIHLGGDHPAMVFDPPAFTYSPPAFEVRIDPKIEFHADTNADGINDQLRIWNESRAYHTQWGWTSSATVKDYAEARARSIFAAVERNNQYVEFLDGNDNVISRADALSAAVNGARDSVRADHRDWWGWWFAPRTSYSYDIPEVRYNAGYEVQQYKTVQPAPYEIDPDAFAFKVDGVFDVSDIKGRLTIDGGDLFEDGRGDQVVVHNEAGKYDDGALVTTSVPLLDREVELLFDDAAKTIPTMVAGQVPVLDANGDVKLDVHGNMKTQAGLVQDAKITYVPRVDDAGNSLPARSYLNLTGLGMGTGTALDGTAFDGVELKNLEDIEIRLNPANNTFTIDSTHEGTTNVITGAGDDVVIVNNISGDTTILGGAGNDRMDVAPVTHMLDGIDAKLTFDGDAHIESVSDPVLYANLTPKFQAVVDASDIVFVNTDGQVVINAVELEADGQVKTIDVHETAGGKVLVQQEIQVWKYRFTWAWPYVEIYYETKYVDQYVYSPDLPLYYDESGEKTTDASGTNSTRPVTHEEYVTRQVLLTRELLTDQVFAGLDTVNIYNDADLADAQATLSRELIQSGATIKSVARAEDSTDDPSITYPDIGDEVKFGDALRGLGMAGFIQYADADVSNILLGSGEHVFNVEGTSAVTNLYTGGGDDTINVTKDGSVDDVTRQLNIDAQGGTNTLNVDDSADADADWIYLSESLIYGMAPGAITYDATGGTFEADYDAASQSFDSRINISAGTGGNTIYVANTRDGAGLGVVEVTDLNAGTGDDYVEVWENDPQFLVVHGQSGDDTINAQWTNGGDGGLTLYGDDGNDTLIGGFGADILIGNQDRDLIYGGSGDDRIFGDDADVTRSAAYATISTTTRNSGGDGDFLIGNAGADLIYGDAGNDTIIGDDGYVIFDAARTALRAVSSGSAGAGDEIYGQDGDDVILGGAGGDTISGGLGHDTILGDHGKVNVNSATNNIISTASSLGGLDTITGDGGNNIIIGGDAGDDLTGGAIDDIMIGDHGTVLRDAAHRVTLATASGSAGGNDTLSAGEGDNIVLGGAGSDTLTMGTGDDVVLGDNGEAAFTSDGILRRIESIEPTVGGNDTIHAGNGVDVVIGGIGADLVLAGGTDGSRDVVLGDSGKATFDATGVLDYISTTAPDHGDADIITTGNGSDVVFGGSGDDVILAATSGVQADVDAALAAIAAGDYDAIDPGDAAADIILGDNGNARFLNGILTHIETSDPTFGGSDTIVAGNGPDVVMGGSGADVILASGSGSLLASGDDLLRDIILGDNGLASFTNAGVLTLIRTTDPSHGGADVITTGNGPNVIMGGAAGDSIRSGTGDDIILGDGGEATFTTAGILSSIQSTDPDSGGNDTIYIGNGADTVIGGSGDDEILASGTDTLRDIVLGDNGLATFTSAGVLNYIRTTDPSHGGVDVITTGSGSNVIMGGAAGDDIRSGSGDDIILGDGGEAVFTTAGILSSIQSIDPTSGGNDTIHVGSGEDTVLGGSGADIILASGDDVLRDIVLGDNGLASFTNAGVLTLIRTTDPSHGGADVITTGNGPNVIMGGAAGDDIRSGSGDDIILGDNGEATFTDDGILRRIESTDPTIGGDDTIHAGNGVDIVFGGIGSDLVLAGGTDGARDIVLGDNGLATFDAAGVLDYITSTFPEYGDTDVITTGNGDDVVLGGSGDDVILAATSGAQADVDAALAAIAAGDYAAIDPGDAAADIILGDNGFAHFLNGTLTHIETSDPTLGGTDTIVAGNGPDVVMGGSGADIILASGDDVLRDIVLGDNGLASFTNAGVLTLIRTTDPSHGGADVITTGNGPDVIMGGAAGDFIESGSGDDIILGDNGEALFTGASVLLSIESTDPTIGGDDTIHAGDGRDIVFGGTGSDMISGGGDSDVLLGDHGHLDAELNYTSIFTGAADGGGSDTIYGDGGDDFILGQQGGDNLFGGAGEDDITGGHNVIGGSDGDDIVDGGTEADVIIGDNGVIVRSQNPDGSYVRHPDPFADVVRSVTRFDDIDYVAGNDTLSGGDGEDIIHGQRGNDTIDGGAGDDELFGELGSDTIQGGTGNDVVLGDVGMVSRALNADGTARINSSGSFHRDVLLEDVGYISEVIGMDTPDGMAADPAFAQKIANSDMVLLTGSYEAGGMASNGYGGVGGKSINPVSGAWGTDMILIDLVDAQDDILDGGEGDDVLFGQRGDDTIAGGAGNDLIFGDAASNLSALETDIPNIVNGVRLIGTTGDTAVPIALEQGGSLVMPWMTMNPMSSSVVTPGINLVPEHIGMFHDLSVDDALMRTDGTVSVPLASFTPDIAHNADALYGNDTIDGGDGDDLIFGDNGRVMAPLETGLKVIDDTLGSIAHTFERIQSQLLDLSYGVDLVEHTVLGEVHDHDIGIGNDTISGGNGMDTIIGDEGVIVIPGTASSPIDVNRHQDSAVEFLGLLGDLEHIAMDFDFAIHTAGHQTFESLVNDAVNDNASGKHDKHEELVDPELHTFSIGNDTIDGGADDDLIIGDDGLMYVPTISAQHTKHHDHNADDIDKRTLRDTERALKDLREEQTDALKDHEHDDHDDDKHHSSNHKDSDHLPYSYGYDYQVGNDVLSGGAGNDVIIGDDATVVTPNVVDAPVTKKDAKRLNQAVDHALTDLEGLLAHDKHAHDHHDHKHDHKHGHDDHDENWVGGNDTIDGGAGDDRLFGDNALVRETFSADGTGIVSGFEIEPIDDHHGNLGLHAGHGHDGHHGEHKGHDHDHGGNDVISGGDGDDVLFGQNGDDRLEGGNGNDLLFGGSGKDTLRGDAGDDALYGGSGKDDLDGGTGDDRVKKGGSDHDHGWEWHDHHDRHHDHGFSISWQNPWIGQAVNDTSAYPGLGDSVVDNDGMTWLTSGVDDDALDGTDDDDDLMPDFGLVSNGNSGNGHGKKK